MKKFLAGIVLTSSLLSGTAMAAELPAAPAAYDWTGFYLGAQVGGDFLSANNVGASNLQNSLGLEGGLNAEFLKQSNKLVFGVVGSGNFSTNSGTANCLNPGATICTLASSWNASVRGKLGYSANNVLFYGTGGWGWADFHKTSSSNNTDIRTLNGWAAGLGVSYAVSPKWVLNLEYLHYDLGSGTPFVVIGGEKAGPSMDTVTVGASYKF